MAVYKPPVPDTKEILRAWCDMQKDKYGENWKELLAAEMAKDTMKQLGYIGINIGKGIK